MVSDKRVHRLITRGEIQVCIGCGDVNDLADESMKDYKATSFLSTSTFHK